MFNAHLFVFRPIKDNNSHFLLLAFRFKFISMFLLVGLFPKRKNICKDCFKSCNGCVMYICIYNKLIVFSSWKCVKSLCIYRRVFDVANILPIIPHYYTTINA